MGITPRVREVESGCALEHFGATCRKGPGVLHDYVEQSPLPRPHPPPPPHQLTLDCAIRVRNKLTQC